MVLYCLLFIHLLLSIYIGNAVRIVGLFPDDQPACKANSNSVKKFHWTDECVGMFRTAMKLAEKYGLMFEEKPINFTIHRTRSSANGFKEFDLVCNLITDNSNRDILGIIGPASSSATRFLGMLATQINMPLISYGATNDELADNEIYQTFYRIAPSDSLLAKAIAQLFKLFSWKTCTLIIGNDDYGYGGLKILSEEYHSNITLQQRIMFDHQRDKFHVDLVHTIEHSSSRIILVWANQSSCSRIIQHALDGNLLGGQYIWILTGQIDLYQYDDQHRSALEGLLMVTPFIPDRDDLGIDETLQKEALDMFYDIMEYPKGTSKDVRKISPFAMYTFDATWMLVRSLSKLSQDESVPHMTKTFRCFDRTINNVSTFLSYLKETNFHGISGAIQFDKNTSNNRKEGVYYGLYNVQRGGMNTMSSKFELKLALPMLWCQMYDKWNNLTNSTKYSITWPNQNINHVPKDYPQLSGKNLRIRVIEAPPFVMVRYGSVENRSNYSGRQLYQHMICSSVDLATTTPGVFIYGFIADVINTLQSNMRFTFTIDLADPNTSYHEMALSVSGEVPKYHMAMSDIRITANRLQIVDFSIPIHENNFRIVVRQNPLSFSSNIFSCFNPFTWDVWVIIGVILIYSGIMIFVFEHNNMRLNNGTSRIHIYVIGVIQTLSSVVIRTGDVSIRSHASRLTVMALYALGIILVAIYTANLSSILTLSRNQNTISGIDDIKNGIIPYTRVGVVTNSAASDYYIQNVSSTFYPLSSAQEMYSRLLDHTIDAAIWDETVLEYVTNHEYCDRLTPVGVGFVRSSFGIAIPKNWPYKFDLDTNILQLRENQVFECLENRWFNARKCSESSDSNTNSVTSKSETFSLSMMSGVFLSFFIVTVVALSLHIFPMIQFRISKIFKPNILSLQSDQEKIDFKGCATETHQCRF